MVAELSESKMVFEVLLRSSSVEQCRLDVVWWDVAIMRRRPADVLEEKCLVKWENASILLYRPRPQRQASEQRNEEIRVKVECNQASVLA